MGFSKSAFVLFCSAYITVVTCKSIDINVGGNINLIALGTVDGKTFFADASARSWTASKTFCYDMGMRLATITSNAQWQLLISKYNANTFSGDHWTAARDSHESRQFTWENLDSQPSETFGIWTNEYRIAYQSCACLNAGPNNREMHFDLCSKSFKVLCETIS